MKFVHIGDAHLGYRQYGLRTREEDYMHAVEHVVSRTIELPGVAAVVWPGDIFDNPTPSAYAVKFVQDQVKRLLKHKIVSIGVDGNHDATKGKWLRVCGIESFNGVDVTIEGVSFAGLNYERPRPFKKKLERLAEQAPNTEVLVIHQPLGDLTAFGCEITAKWIAGKFPKLKYVALGDIHNYGIWDIDGVTFVYPGSVEMTDIDEEPSKVFVIVDIEDGKVTTAYETTNPRPIVAYEVRTQEELEALIADVEGTYGGAVLPNVRLNSDLVGAVAKLQGALGGRIPYRLERFSEATGLSEHVIDRNWTRVGLIDLISIVENSHKKDSDEYQLIVNMLDNPDQVLSIAEEYIANKGLTELCQM